MYELYLKSGDREKYTEICYEHESEFLGRVPSEYEEVDFEDWLSALKTAKLLDDWASEIDEDRITERYGVGPGDIRGKVDTAEWLLGAAEQFILTVTETGFGKRSSAYEYRRTGRGGQGLTAHGLGLFGTATSGSGTASLSNLTADSVDLSVAGGTASTEETWELVITEDKTSV